MTTTTSTEPCCPEFAAALPPRPLHRRRRPGRRHHGHRLRRRPRLRRARHARPAPSWSCCRCAAPPTGSRWSSRTATPSTTPARPADRDPGGPAARQGRHVRPAPRAGAAAAAVERRASSPPSTPPGCPPPTARTSRRWRRSRTPTPAPTLRAGWLNRLIGTDGNDSPLQAFNLARRRPAGLAVRRPADRLRRRASTRCTIPGDDEWDPDGRRMRSLHRLWDSRHVADGQGDAVDVPGGRRTSSRSATPRDDAARTARSYPDNDLGRALREVARIVRGDVGVEVITVDQGDWDHHTGLGTLERGGMIRQRRATSPASIAAFFKDLGDARRQGHPGHDQRVRPPGEGERQLRPRPRLRQRDVPGRRGRQGRQYYGTTGPASRTTSTPT